MRGLLLGTSLALISGTTLAKEIVVSQKGKQFSESTLTIAPGDTVVFKNDDDTPHNVFSASEGQKFNLKVQKAGTETRQAFATAGEVDIRCAIHPKMKLHISVKP